MTTKKICVKVIFIQGPFKYIQGLFKDIPQLFNFQGLFKDFSRPVRTMV